MYLFLNQRAFPTQGEQFMTSAGAETCLWRRFMLETIFLPRQARVKHREKLRGKVSAGTELWNHLCETGAMAYKTQLEDGSNSVYETLVGGCSCPYGVWLSPATLATGGFDDGIYLHTGAPMDRETAPQSKLAQVRAKLFLPPLSS
jgi:hypothetical protein